MDKTFHMMAGLPRSSSTVLSAILNQHPDLYVSPQTDLLHMLFTLYRDIPNYESYIAGIRHSGYENSLRKLAHSFYEDINKPIVIDKNRGWGTPYNWNNISGYVNPEAKVIITLRPILEILASFVRKANENKDNFIDKSMVNMDFYPIYYRTINDARCDFLMRSNGEIDQAILSVSNLIKNHSERCKVVWHNDFIDNPNQALNEINDFLGIDKFEYNLMNIKEIDKHKDLNAFGIRDLHTIKPVLSPSKTDPSKVLSDYVIGKYQNALDFLTK